MLTTVLYTVLILAVIAVVFGIAISLLNTHYKDKKDKGIEEILAFLPGVNCGACGYSSCSKYAEAINSGEVKVGRCQVMSKEKATELMEYVAKKTKK
ncbi:MAG: (Fe-S)-binding protein [Clostridia bacterium]|nr:hypothetical protein [Clostridia bacterium]